MFPILIGLTSKLAWVQNKETGVLDMLDILLELATLVTRAN
jgi:oligoribonuclease (3'-5' exoribonuclease)